MADSALLSVDFVLIVSEDASAIDTIRLGLPAATEVGSIGDCSFEALSREISVYEPNLIIVASKTATSELMRALDQTLRTFSLPIMVFVDEDTDDFAANAVRIGVSAFVVDGLISKRIISLATVALERFKLFQALQSELQKSKDTLVARKTIEQAKGLLMQRQNLSEQDAYKKLRSMAMRQGKPIKDIADTVISMADLLP